MADNISLKYPTYEQIAVTLERLATNYSNMASVFYEIFYYDKPTDVTFSLYDEEGVLQTYTVPNRAKDMQNLLSGEGNPEGSVEGVRGALYQDLTNGDLYIKETEEGSEGWFKITTDNYLRNIFIQGNGSPEGNVEAPKGILYIDTDHASLYIKATPTGNVGWEMISATIGQFADVDLSNLSPTGENRFLDRDLSNITDLGKEKIANRSLSNLDGAGEARFDEKEDKINKVTSISATSNNIEYPSAKCVYNELQKKQDVLVSGENIKTINGNSIVGRGNLDIDIRGTILDILMAMYPVGAIFIGTTSTCPMEAFFGTWQKVATDRVLQGSSSSHPADSTIAASLPNIRGAFHSHRNYFPSQPSQGGIPSGAFYYNNDIGFNDSYGYHEAGRYGNIEFDANKSNSMYKQNSTVQPPAYVVNVWKRIA